MTGEGRICFLPLPGLLALLLGQSPSTLVNLSILLPFWSSHCHHHLLPIQFPIDRHLLPNHHLSFPYQFRLFWLSSSNFQPPMARRDNNPRRTSKRPNSNPTQSNLNQHLENPRRAKGRARTRASGVKIIDDPMGDEKRLKDQLTQMGLYAVNTLGDGNCLFRALSDQLYGNPNRHLDIRLQVCSYLAQHESRYKAFVDMDEEESWESHLQQMAKQGTYGGHLELSAFANSYRRSIKIIQPGMVYVIGFEDESPRSNFKKVKGKEKEKVKRPDESSGPILYLVYHQWEHYSSVRNLDGPHSGIPCIRERNLEGSVGNNEEEKQGDPPLRQRTNYSSQKQQQQQNNGINRLNLTTYRESLSSPSSAGSSAAPSNSSAINSVSSPSSTLSTGNGNRKIKVSKEENRTSDQGLPDSMTTQEPTLANHEYNQYPKRGKRSKIIQDNSKPKSSLQRNFNHSSSTQQISINDKDFNQNDLKPLSKKEKRNMNKRNKSRLPISSSNQPSQSQEFKIETVGLFKELKV